MLPGLRCARCLAIRFCASALSAKGVSVWKLADGWPICKLEVGDARAVAVVYCGKGLGLEDGGGLRLGGLDVGEAICQPVSTPTIEANLPNASPEPIPTNYLKSSTPWPCWGVCNTKSESTVSEVGERSASARTWWVSKCVRLGVRRTRCWHSRARAED